MLSEVRHPKSASRNATWIGLFLSLLFLFLRFLPMISIFEMRTMLPEARVDEEAI